MPRVTLFCHPIEQKSDKDFQIKAFLTLKCDQLQL
jgi:hypothetical protein